MKQSIRLTLNILLLAISLHPKADAAENRWSSNGPQEATVSTIGIDPRDNHRIFAGTIQNGLYFSVDGGDSWNHIDDDSLNSTVYDIAFCPTGPDTMYAATWGGMYRSYNGGVSWGLLRPPGYWYSPFNDIEVNPLHQNVILAGADMATGYKSTDGGNNWTHLNLPWIAVLAIRTDPLRPDTFYLASQSGQHGLAVMRSEDLGETWYSVQNDLDSGLVSWDLAIDPVNSDILYLAGSRYPFTDPGVCLAKTTDAGNHWFDITPEELIRFQIRSVTISPFDHNTLYICTEANGVLESIDGGESWQMKNEGLSARNVKSICIDSTTGIIYLGTFYNGLFRSRDDGENWERISVNFIQAECTDMAVNFRNSDSVYVATIGGVYRSSDGANSWQRLEFDIPYFCTESNGVEVDPYDPDYIYVSFFDREGIGDGGIFRSTDGGESWVTFTSGLPAGGFYRMMTIANFGDGSRRIFLGGIGLYYSDDLGQSWQLSEAGLPSDLYYWCLVASKVDPNLVYTVNGGQSWAFYRSTDAGDTWAALPAPSGPGDINTIACDPIDRNIVYICKRGEGVFKSTDAGESWIDITNDLPYDPDLFSVSGIAINPLNPDNLYINSYYMGAFVSHNGGQNWEDFNEGLDTRYASAITMIPPSDTNRIYLATSPRSVWTFTRTETSIDNEISPPDKFLSLSNYPNPFNSSTIIKIAVNKTVNINLDIYNLLGQHVETIFFGILQAGQYAFTWDASSYPSSVYFARLKTPDTIKNISLILLK